MIHEGTSQCADPVGQSGVDDSLEDDRRACDNGKPGGYHGGHDGSVQHDDDADQGKSENNEAFLFKLLSGKTEQTKAVNSQSGYRLAQQLQSDNGGYGYFPEGKVVCNVHYNAYGTAKIYPERALPPEPLPALFKAAQETAGNAAHKVDDGGGKESAVLCAQIAVDGYKYCQNGAVE